MAYQKLTPAQEEQIVRMWRDGKSPEEVSAFFKTTYGIKLPFWKIHYVIGRAKDRGGYATDSLKKKSKRDKKWLQKKHAAAEAEETSGEEVNVQELTVLLQQLDAGYKKLVAHYKNKFKDIRSELVKARGELCRMIRGAGMEIPEEMDSESVDREDN